MQNLSTQARKEQGQVPKIEDDLKKLDDETEKHPELVNLDSGVADSLQLTLYYLQKQTH